mgnify:CR=1 FL=1
MTIKDAHGMIAGITPVLVPGDWVFCSTDAITNIPADAMAVIREAEGTTLILPDAKAQAAGYTCSAPLRQITLQVLSDLEGVGLTAAVATALAAEGIACNVVAAFHHDHIFVPKAQAEHACDILRRVQQDALHARP